MPSMSTPPHCRPRGFSLTELMIVLAISAILAALAHPGFRRFVLRAQRAEARATLAEAAHFMERFRSIHDRYDRRRVAAGAADVPVQLPESLARSPAQGPAHHRIVLQSVDAGSYRLQAQPLLPDAECGTLGLDQTGAREASGSEGAAACWR